LILSAFAIWYTIYADMHRTSDDLTLETLQSIRSELTDIHGSLVGGSNDQENLLKQIQLLLAGDASKKELPKKKPAD
jgi:hypothetical protein